jgi:hypothetical protein
MVEGQARHCFSRNPPKHRIGVIEKFGSGNAESVNSGCFQPLVSSCIALRPVAARMCLSIHLYREPSIAAEEIQDKRTRRVLSPEL